MHHETVNTYFPIMKKVSFILVNTPIPNYAYYRPHKWSYGTLYYHALRYHVDRRVATPSIPGYSWTRAWTNEEAGTNSMLHFVCQRSLKVNQSRWIPDEYGNTVTYNLFCNRLEKAVLVPNNWLSKIIFKNICWYLI